MEIGQYIYGCAGYPAIFNIRPDIRQFNLLYLTTKITLHKRLFLSSGAAKQENNSFEK